MSDRRKNIFKEHCDIFGNKLGCLLCTVRREDQKQMYLCPKQRKVQEQFGLNWMQKKSLWNNMSPNNPKTILFTCYILLDCKLVKGFCSTWVWICRPYNEDSTSAMQLLLSVIASKCRLSVFNVMWTCLILNKIQHVKRTVLRLLEGSFSMFLC